MDAQTRDASTRSLAYRLSRGLAGWLVAAAIRLLGHTWRLERIGEDPMTHDPRQDPLVMVIWHGGLGVAAYGWRDRDIAVAVSLSRDGDWIDAVLRRLGFAESPRGSSSRGALGLLRELIRRTRAGVPIGILLDGPRGPAGVAKPGAVALARATGARLVPIGVAAAPGHRFASWDRTLLPYPFARVRIVFGAPRRVPREADEAALEAERLALERELHRLDRAAAEALGGGRRTPPLP